jgi:hypothetical protein
MVNIEELSAKTEFSNTELLDLMTTQFQILFAFKQMKHKHANQTNLLETLVKTDCQVAGHIISLNALITKE